MSLLNKLNLVTMLMMLSSVTVTAAETASSEGGRRMWARLYTCVYACTRVYACHIMRLSPIVRPR